MSMSVCLVNTLPKKYFIITVRFIEIVQYFLLQSHFLFYLRLNKVNYFFFFIFNTINTHEFVFVQSIDPSNRL